jgi:predicted nucleic acid-binding protein
MIILDTNVLSALMSRQPDRRVIAWLDNQPRTSVWTTSVTVLEIQFGLQILPAGRRRAHLMRAFGKLLEEKIEGRIAAFDAAAAQHAGDLMAIRHRKGRPVELRDTMIAGIVLARRATLATRNTAHFDDIAARIVNPWLSA